MSLIEVLRPVQLNIDTQPQDLPHGELGALVVGSQSPKRKNDFVYITPTGERVLSEGHEPDLFTYRTPNGETVVGYK